MAINTPIGMVFSQDKLFFTTARNETVISTSEPVNKAENHICQTHIHIADSHNKKSSPTLEHLMYRRNFDILRETKNSNAMYNIDYTSDFN